jgi:hypothetical protein
MTEAQALTQIAGSLYAIKWCLAIIAGILFLKD